jgi:hypothetical protein
VTSFVFNYWEGPFLSEFGLFFVCLSIFGGCYLSVIASRETILHSWLIGGIIVVYWDIEGENIKGRGDSCRICGQSLLRGIFLSVILGATKGWITTVLASWQLTTRNKDCLLIIELTMFLERCYFLKCFLFWIKLK